MDYRKDMERCLAALQNEPQQSVCAKELAQKAGYSYFHFCHVFKSIYGVSVGAFLRERRLFDAAQQLRKGASVTAAAFSNGFDTVSGFDKAFRRVFGVAPSVFQKQQEVDIMLIPTFQSKQAFFAAGYVLPAEEDVNPESSGAYWLGKDFSAVSAEDYARLCAPGYAEIGTWLQPENEDGTLCYFLGPEVRANTDVPAQMRLLEFPAADYAVFEVPKGETLEQLHENVSAVWRFIFREWFASGDYAFDTSARDFECYRGEDTLIFVPVVKKENTESK